MTLTRPQNTRVRHHVAIHLAHPLKGVKKHDEEHQHGSQRHFGLKSQAQPDDEDGAEYNTWDRVERLDVDAKHVGQESIASQHDAKDDAKEPTDEKTEDRLH